MAFKFSAPIVASFGEEPYFLDLDLHGYTHRKDRQVVVVDGSEFKKDYDFVSFCETRTFEEIPRLIVLDNADKIKPEKALKAYVEKLNPKDLSLVLALLFRDGKLPAFWSKLTGKILSREHKKLKTFESNNEVVRWIEEEIRRQGLRAEARIANIIYSNVGSDLYRISSEVRKLKVFLGEGGEIKVENLQATLTVGVSVDAWQVVDAAANKEVKKAINLLTSFYKYTSEDPSILLSYSLMKQVERMYIASHMLSKGAGEEDVAIRISMHPWRCKTFFIPMVRKHTLAELSDMMRTLCRLDMETKRATRSKRTLLELAILRLSGAYL